MARTDREQDLRKRTKQYALRIIRLYMALPRNGAGEVIGRQLLKSGTSPGAHYREACRARSTAEFISKVEGGLQELDESDYWLDLLVESGLVRPEALQDLQQETRELIAIFAASVITAKKSRRRT